MAKVKNSASNKPRLEKEYREVVLGKYLRFAIIGIFVVFVGIAYFIYEDSVHRLPTESVAFRLVPAVCALLLFIALLTPLKKRVNLIIALYYLCLGGLMTMMAGLVVITAGTGHYELYLLGTVVVIFCVYLCNLFGMKYLIPVYAIPLGSAIGVLLMSGSVTLGRLLELANPVVVASVCCLLADIQNRIRFNDFTSGKIIERQNMIFNKELALSLAVQRNLFPQKMPDIDEIEIAADYLPMIGIGGDLYDFIEFREDAAFGLFMCDVSGHGVSAALVSSMVKAHLNTARDTVPSPARVLGYLNDNLTGQIGDHFLTAIYGLYRTTDRSFTYARGGHSYPILLRNGKVTELASRGGFIGRFSTMSFEEREMRLEPGDRLVLYTDGIIEARNDDGVVFGEERLIGVIEENSDTDSGALISEIISSVKRFQNREDFDDDVCVITMLVK